MKLFLDTEDGERLSLRLLDFNKYVRDDADHDGATADDLDKVRAFPQRRYSERSGAWLIPLTEPNVGHLLTSWDLERQAELTDAAKLMLRYHSATNAVADLRLQERLSYMKDGLVKEPGGYVSPTVPFKHQLVAFSSARDAEFFSLTMEMGTGKTKVVVDVMCDRVRRAREKDPFAQLRVLIVAPKRVCHTWFNEHDGGELAKHASMDMSVERLRGSQVGRAERLAALLGDRDDAGQRRNTPLIVAIINYEGLDLISDALGLVPWDLMVLDESINIKHMSTKRAKAAKRVGESARSRFILTGLPITRSVTDLYSQYDFLKPGCLGYTSKASFEGRFECDSQEEFEKYRLPELQKQLGRFSFMIKRSQCLDLPPKTYQTLEIEMGQEQADAYRQMLEDSIVQLEGLNGQDAKGLSDEQANELMESMVESNEAGQFSTASIVLVQMLRLAQITSGFMKMSDKTIYRFPEQPKMDALDELVEELPDTGKVIVWSRFREDVKEVEKRFQQKYGVAAVMGGMSDKAVEDAIYRFKQDARCRIFASLPASAKYGLTLTEAQNTVYLSNDFSLDNRGQSEDRNHRIGQTGTVLYTDMCVPNSIDQLVVERLRTKRNLAELLTNRDKLVSALKAQLEALRV